MTKHTRKVATIESSGWPGLVRLALCIFVPVASATTAALAQTQSLPGLVIKQPDNDQGTDKSDRKSAKQKQTADKDKSKRRSGSTGSITRPVVIVNGLPITNEEIDMRANLLSLGPQLNDRVKAQFKAMTKSPAINERWNAIRDKVIRENQHTGSVEIIKAKLGAAMKNFQMDLSKQAFRAARDGFAKNLRSKAREDLIDEQIKLNAPRELNLKINEQAINEAVDSIMKERAQKAKMTTKQFGEHLRSLGTDYDMMRQSIRAQFIWREVVRMKFRPFISPNLKEVDEVITSAPIETAEGDDSQVKLHRIVVKLPPNATQTQKIQTQVAAEKIMKSFKGCSSTQKLAAQSGDTKFEDLGTKQLSEIPEPARSLLRYAKAGEILPPQPAFEGLHLYALCERTTNIKANQDSRKQAEAKIVAEALDQRSRGLLLDLRRRARVEER